MNQPGRWVCFIAASVCLLTLGCMLGPLAPPAHAQRFVPPRGAPERFHFTIDPKTPLKDLLPVPPDVADPTPPWLVKDWTQVPEVLFQKPYVPKAPDPPKTAPGEFSDNIDLPQTRDLLAAKHTAHVIADQPPQ